MEELEEICIWKNAPLENRMITLRCVNLLKNGGKLAIVLPDGILSNSSLKPV